MSVPTIEPAPPLFSMTIAWPMFSLTFLATMRATEFGAAARRVGNDELDRLGRIIRGQGSARQALRRERERQRRASAARLKVGILRRSREPPP